MGTQPPDRDDPYEDIDPDDLLEEPGLEVRELDDAEFRTPDGAYSDEPYDPAFQAVIEAGGGVAEGFEQSEAELLRIAWPVRAPARLRPQFDE